MVDAPFDCIGDNRFVLLVIRGVAGLDVIVVCGYGAEGGFVR